MELKNKVLKKTIDISLEVSNLKRYIKEINQYKILSKAEEIILAKKMQTGDLMAREQMIRCNLRFVVSIAKSYVNKGVAFLDLINEGNIGLILACDRFDYSKGYRFISYAVWWVKQYIAKAFAEQLGLIRLPMNKALLHFKVRNLMEKYARTKDIEKKTWGDIYDQIAKNLSIKRLDLDLIMNSNQKYISFTSEIDMKDQQRNVYFEEILEDLKNKKPEEVVLNREMNNYLHGCLNKLSNKEGEILTYRYGLNTKEILSLEEIGKIFNVSKERIRQIEKKAIKKLKAIMRDEGMDFLLF